MRLGPGAHGDLRLRPKSTAQPPTATAVTASAAHHKNHAPPGRLHLAGTKAERPGRLWPPTPRATQPGPRVWRRTSTRTERLAITAGNRSDQVHGTMTAFGAGGQTEPPGMAAVEPHRERRPPLGRLDQRPHHTAGITCARRRTSPQIESQVTEAGSGSGQVWRRTYRICPLAPNGAGTGHGGQAGREGGRPGRQPGCCGLSRRQRSVWEWVHGPVPRWGRATESRKCVRCRKPERSEGGWSAGVAGAGCAAHEPTQRNLDRVVRREVVVRRRFRSWWGR